MTDIQNSFQLEFVAYFSMHLENIHLQITGSKDTRQRDRYMQLIEMINQAPFDLALQKYQQIALADADITMFSDSMIKTAKRLACQELGLPETSADRIE
ncbi:hypothetical protein [Methylovorus glucosotrophus]|jgi:hypothetical protein|uniref:Uncharacterized protein n=1 Tax=Methylovorus glucosotrophus (strain SIP3-4) TaxID=582744 RepID=C6XBR5_METGS|nr:hypothetical protein [Methylovorus glucosotrophus]ACT52035.1 hypothetical protein Msip34_2798 [Methylovorus glucosotrophus SIP3-4]KAF0842692.1 hypothetical protein FNL37_0101 [Methylovorus glucosotrophus]